jgi:hypothetical protein
MDIWIIACACTTNRVSASHFSRQAQLRSSISRYTVTASASHAFIRRPKAAALAHSRNCISARA